MGDFYIVYDNITNQVLCKYEVSELDTRTSWYCVNPPFGLDWNLGEIEESARFPSKMSAVHSIEELVELFSNNGEETNFSLVKLDTEMVEVCIEPGVEVQFSTGSRLRA